MHKYFTTDNFPRNIRLMKEAIWGKKKKHLKSTAAM